MWQKHGESLWVYVIITVKQNTCFDHTKILIHKYYFVAPSVWKDEDIHFVTSTNTVPVSTKMSKMKAADGIHFGTEKYDVSVESFVHKIGLPRINFVEYCATCIIRN